MAQAIATDTRLVLKYADKDSFSFGKLKPGAADEDLYNAAECLNAFQDGAMTQVVKSVTNAILQ